MNEESVFLPGRAVRLVWLEDNIDYSINTEIVRSDGSAVYLRAPQEAERSSPVQFRAEIRLFVSLEEGEAEYATVFEGVEEELNGVPLWIVRYPKMRVAMLRHRRQHYRISMAIPLNYVFLPEAKAIPIEYPHQGEIVNLSRGGMRVYTSTPLKQNDQLEVMFAIPPFRMILRTSVVMSRGMSPGGKYVSEAAMRFLVLEGKQRDRLSRFIMQEQGKRRVAER